jgi:hypothetical protein
MNGRATETTTSGMGRGQSSVVGVALLLGATVLALGALTASVGTLVDGQTASADAERVADDFEDALRPVETTGYRSETVRFGDGTLRTVERKLRVLDSSGVVETVDVGGLVYERGDHRVVAVAGAVVRSHGDSAWTVDPPPVVGSKATDSLVVGAGKLNASDGAVGGGATLRLETNVSHDRRALGPGQYAVAIETAVPGAFERVFEERGATVTRRDFDGDGVPSVVAAYPGRREAYLVVHDMRLEVNGA